MIVTEGQRVIADRYHLVAPIGSGGVGVVWRARDRLLDREVAVKEIVRLVAAGRDTQDEIYRQTLHEARAAARIRHPGVAAVYDVISEAGRPYIVMELIEGRPLAQVIGDEGPLALPRVADIGRQVLAALTAGHAAGVLHRDLKPANVLVTASGRAVLTDFGIASVIGDPSITLQGVVVGTPGYLAPERAKGERATAAADMWSLGATLYAACSGRGPYDGHGSVAAALAAIINRDPPELAVGGPLSGLIHALMNRDPQRRPGAAQTARVLGEAAGGVPRTVLAPKPVTQPPLAQAPLAQAPVTQPPVTQPPVTQPRPEEDQMVTAPVVTGPPAATWDAPEPATSLRPGSLRRRRAALVAGATAVAAAALLATAVTIVVRSHDRSAGATLAGAASPVPALQQEFRVTAVLNGNGSPELFARARTGDLMAGRFADGSWSGWTRLPGGHIYSGVPAVAVSHDGRLVLVARTASGKLALLWQSAPGSGAWDGPVALGSELTASDPAVIALPDGRLDVFARLRNGSLGAVWQLGATAASRWSAWASLGGSLAGPPVAALDSEGDPQVFAVGAGGTLMHDYFEVGSWQGWHTLPGGRVFTGLPSVGRNFDGRLEVFARTSSGALEHVWQVPGHPDRWGGPLVLMKAIAGDPAVYSTVGGRIEAFAVAPDGSVLHSWQDQVQAGTNWSPPASIGGDSAGVAVPVRTDGRSEVFAPMPGGAIAWDRESARLSWSGWSGLGGSF